MDPELQKLHDVLTATQAHRNQVLDAHALLQAEIAALKRMLADRDDQIRTLQAEVVALGRTVDRAA